MIIKTSIMETIAKNNYESNHIRISSNIFDFVHGLNDQLHLT